jgi:NADH-quinone oxidoreductase subunit L
LADLLAPELLLWLIPTLPFAAFVVIAIFTFRSRKLSHSIALVGAGFSFTASMLVILKALQIPELAKNPIASQIKWFPTGDSWFLLGVQIDPLTVVTLAFVAVTILMIFIYSVGYHNFGAPEGSNDIAGLPPKGAEVSSEGHTHRVPSVEPMYSRFFALISLFAFAMYLLVVSDNLLGLYIGWEIMGLCSYLLIGFWYGRESARKAAIKAFITTRIGDVFMLLGLAALYALTGTLNYQQILANPIVLNTLATSASPIAGLSWAGLIGLLLFAGTIGKSAQFPLHVWLPDAMEGPTPVSAMIHAATMVSAGVYLVARFFPLISAGWTPGQPLTTPMLVMAAVGAFTALFAATIAATQNDIKRVLAYSTISQLGYMVAALGIGAYSAAVFHLFTHAFFKALLFLGSGSVIHGMEHGAMHTGDEIDTQNMRNMGGLGKKMPLTFAAFLAGGLALSGFPLITAGFWSKDAILSGAFTQSTIVFIALALAALLTAFYTARQITLVFLGNARSKAAGDAVESRPAMTIPLAILAVFAIAAGWIGIPKSFPLLGRMSSDWFAEFTGSMLSFKAVEGHSMIPLITSLTVALGGLLLGWLVYRRVKQAKAVDPMEKALGGGFRIIQKKYLVDEFYDLIFIRPSLWFADVFVAKWMDQVVIDGIINGIGRLGLFVGSALRNGFDAPVINGAADGIANGTRGAGGLLRRLQTGRVQQYLAGAVGGLVVLVIVLYTIFK